jgi:cobalt-zinc-cadmium efflux system membrane fusion protein
MFANVTLFSNGHRPQDFTPAVPRSAVIYEGDAARLWVAHDDHSIELRQIKIGLSDGKMVQVLSGVRVGEKVVTKGTLFIDRTASGS